MPVKDFLNGIPCMLVYNGFMIAGDNDTLLNRDIASCLLFKMLFIISLHPEIPFIKRIAKNTENRFLFPVISIIFLKSRPPAQPPALLVVWDCPLQGPVAFPPKGGLTNHVHYVTGGRLKAAFFVVAFRTLLLADPSHIAH